MKHSAKYPLASLDPETKNWVEEARNKGIRLNSDLLCFPSDIQNQAVQLEAKRHRKMHKLHQIKEIARIANITPCILDQSPDEIIDEYGSVFEFMRYMRFQIPHECVNHYQFPITHKLYSYLMDDMRPKDSLNEKAFPSFENIPFLFFESFTDDPNNC